MLGSAKKIIQGLSNYTGVTGMFTLLIMMLFTTYDVIGRSFFRSPIVGSYELTRYMLVVVVLLGLPYTQQVEGNVRITFFLSRMDPRARAIIDIFTTFFCFVFFLVITWGGWLETVSSFRGGGVSDMLRIPEWPFRFLISFGTFLLSLELLIKLAVYARQLITNQDRRG